ncbi:MAG: ATP-binding protein [Bacteroidia bacterium]|jgi:hypothetical protein|nr:ATP-binding protein [Bacteroidia bacterium]
MMEKTIHLSMLQRQIQPRIEKWFFRHKALVITGARQVGKSTLVNQLAEAAGEKSVYLNADEARIRKLLKDPDRNQLSNIIGKSKLVIFDEIQRIENCGLLLKICVDNFKSVQFLATGSSALDISEKIFEPLTGRHLLYHLYPFSLRELYADRSSFEVEAELPFHLVFGMYPDVCTNKTEAELLIKNLTNQYLYKDVLAWKDIRKPDLLDKLLQLLAHQAGSEVSLHELALNLGIKTETVESYIGLLEKSFVVYRLSAFSNNPRKEVTKMKKILFWDNGIRNAIVGDFRPLSERSDAGILWENFMISERMKQNAYLQNDVRSFFWRSLQKQEVDYVEIKGKQISAFEMKWNNRRTKITKAFTNLYPKASTQLVQPTNFAEFCYLQKEENP